MNQYCVFELEKPFTVMVLLEGLAPEVIMSTDAPMDNELIAANDNDNDEDDYDQVTRTDATHPSAPLHLLTRFIGSMAQKHMRSKEMGMRTCEVVKPTLDHAQNQDGKEEIRDIRIHESGMMCRWRIQGVFECIFNIDNAATDLSVLFWLYGIRCFQEGMNAFGEKEYSNSEIWLQNAKMAFFHLSNTGTREGHALFRKDAPPIMKGYVCKAFEMLVLAHHYMIKANMIFSADNGTFDAEVSEMGIYLATKAGHVADIAYKVFLNADGADTMPVDAIEKFKEACTPLRTWALFLKAVKYFYDDEYKEASAEIMNNMLTLSRSYKKMNVHMSEIIYKLLKPTSMGALMNNVSGWFKTAPMDLSLAILPELENPNGSIPPIPLQQIQVHNFLFPEIK